MKKRVISAVVALLISVPLLVLGKVYFNIFVCLLGLIGLWELFRLNNLPENMKYCCYIMFLLFTYLGKDYIGYYDLIYLFIFMILVPIVIFHDDKLYNITHAFYMFSSVLILSVLFNNFIIVRGISLSLTIYLILITTMTDTFAYVLGSKYGKHKLSPSLSPKKSIEGAIYGSLIGTFISSIFYIIFIGNMNIFIVIFMTFILTIVGQVGDLLFSSIKRHYNIKDFSNIMPGHGGILDRLDSLLLVVLTYLIIVNL